MMPTNFVGLLVLRTGHYLLQHRLTPVAYTHFFYSSIRVRHFTAEVLRQSQWKKLSECIVSLVDGFLRSEEDAGSNPAIPTI